MDRQKEILNVFQNSDRDILKKSEIISLGRISYYYNTNKHVGETLCRMVKNKLLERVKKGSYRCSGRTTPNHSKGLDYNKNQTELFEL